MEFPKISPEIQSFDSLDSLKKIISIQFRQLQAEKGLKFKFPFSYHYKKMKNISYIRVRCIFCSAHLNWKQTQENRYILTKYRNFHDHENMLLNQILRKNNKKSRVLNYIQTIDFTSDPCKLSGYIASKFGIDQKYAQIIIRQKQKSWGQNLADISKTLQQKSIFLYHWPLNLNRIPQVTVLITQEMRNLYRQFGHVIKIDFTRGMISGKIQEQQTSQLQPPQVMRFEQQREQELYQQSSSSSEPKQQNKKDSEQKQLILGLFSGVNSLNRTVIYGIIIATGETRDIIKRALQNFFQYMGQQCQTIITNRGIGYIQAIESLNQNFFTRKVTHIFNTFDIMKNLKIKDQRIALNQAIKTSTPTQFNYIFDQLYSSTDQNSQQKLDKFVKLADKCCIPMIRDVRFLGFSSSTDTSEWINNYIRNKIKFAMPYWRFVPKIIWVCQYINRNSKRMPIISNIPIQRISSMKNLEVWKNRLPKAVFEKILYNYIKSIGLDLISKQDTSIKIKQRNDIYKLTLEDGKWNCVCAYLVKTDIPCPHLLKIIDDITPYIGAFWKKNVSLLPFSPTKITRALIPRKRML